jgi:hypothetical protein
MENESDEIYYNFNNIRGNGTSLRFRRPMSSFVGHVKP